MNCAVFFFRLIFSSEYCPFAKIIESAKKAIQDYATVEEISSISWVKSYLLSQLLLASKRQKCMCACMRVLLYAAVGISNPSKQPIVVVFCFFVSQIKYTGLEFIHNTAIGK